MCLKWAQHLNYFHVITSYSIHYTKLYDSAQDTDFFPQFLAAVGYFQRGAKNWKVNISEMCVGRDCKSAKLTAKLKIETVKIKEPQTEDIKN